MHAYLGVERGEVSRAKFASRLRVVSKTSEGGVDDRRWMDDDVTVYAYTDVLDKVVRARGRKEGILIKKCITHP